MILGSPVGSHRYCSALATLLSSDHEQKLLYTLSDHSAIEGMLNVLELVSVDYGLPPSEPTLIPEILQPEGVTGHQFETQDEEGTKESIHYSQEGVSGTRQATFFICGGRGD